MFNAQKISAQFGDDGQIWTDGTHDLTDVCVATGTRRDGVTLHDLAPGGEISQGDVWDLGDGSAILDLGGAWCTAYEGEDDIWIWSSNGDEMSEFVQAYRAGQSDAELYIEDTTRTRSETGSLFWENRAYKDLQKACQPGVQPPWSGLISSISHEELIEHVGGDSKDHAHAYDMAFQRTVENAIENFWD